MLLLDLAHLGLLEPESVVSCASCGPAFFTLPVFPVFCFSWREASNTKKLGEANLARDAPRASHPTSVASNFSLPFAPRWNSYTSHGEYTDRWCLIDPTAAAAVRYTAIQTHGSRQLPGGHRHKIVSCRESTTIEKLQPRGCLRSAEKEASGETYERGNTGCNYEFHISWDWGTNAAEKKARPARALSTNEQ